MTDNKSLPEDVVTQAVAKMQQAFYVDFVPMIQKIQYDVSVMNCFSDEKSKKYYIDDKQIKNFAYKVLEKDN